MTCSHGQLTQRSLAAHRPLHISFGGCAALGVYHTGVWKCIADHAPHLLEEFEQLYGASAGAFTAVCAVCKCDPTVVYEWITDTFKSSREFCVGFGVVKPSFNLYARLRRFLEKILPQDAHRLCRNRVNISLSVMRGLTELPRNWLLSDFTTRKELINAIIASSLMPGYGGVDPLPLIRGKRCFDGGFTSNIPLVSNPNVISVTPFSGESDICPPMETTPSRHVLLCDQPFQVTSKNLSRLKIALCPTSLEALEESFHEGSNNALTFLRRRGLVEDSGLKEGDRLNLDEASLFPEDSGFFSSSQSENSDELETESSHCEEEMVTEDKGLVMMPLNERGLLADTHNGIRKTHNSDCLYQVIHKPTVHV